MKNQKKSGGTALLIILIVIFGILLAGFIGLNFYLSKINVADDTPAVEATDAKGDPLQNGEIDLRLVDPIYDGKVFNILLVGQDRLEGQGRQRSDSMIVVSVNNTTHEVSLISFLRDTYVQIPGYDKERLNAAYVYGGLKLLEQTLNYNFGIEIDGGFEVDFDGFTDIIDLIGGLDIELTSREAQIVGCGDEAGMYHLNGADALMYARIRKIDSDFNRTARQRTVLMTAYNKIKDCSLTDLNRILNTALESCTTDLTKTKILKYAASCMPLINNVTISNYSVPDYGLFRDITINGAMMLDPDLDAIREKLQNEYMPLDNNVG